MEEAAYAGVAQGDNAAADRGQEIGEEQENELLMDLVGGNWRPVPTLLSSFEDIPRWNFVEQEYMELCTEYGNLDWEKKEKLASRLHLRLYKPFLTMRPWKKTIRENARGERREEYLLPICPDACESPAPNSMYCHQKGTIIYSDVDTSLVFETEVCGDNVREGDIVSCRVPIRVGPTVVSWCPQNIRHKGNPWRHRNSADSLRFFCLEKRDLLDDLSYMVSMRRLEADDVKASDADMFRMRMGEKVKMSPGLAVLIKREGVMPMDWHVGFRMMESSNMEFLQIVANIPVFGIFCEGGAVCASKSMAVDMLEEYH